jgi:hypothetical protein
MDANPQIRHVLSDPAVLRQSLEMMRNPNAMREAMRHQDIAMSQVRTSCSYSQSVYFTRALNIAGEPS